MLRAHYTLGRGNPWSNDCKNSKKVTLKKKDNLNDILEELS